MRGSASSRGLNGRLSQPRALEALRAQRAWVPTTFYHALAEPSVRQAARVLHLHHSTLQQRLDWLQGRLGYDLQSAEGRLRASTAWALWRISGQLRASHGRT